MKPMLARPYSPSFTHYPCHIQPKLNGVRALYQNGLFQSRDEQVWQPAVLAHLTSQLASITPLLGSVILDGELYVHGWKLQRINSAVAVHRNAPNQDTPYIMYHVFDAIIPDTTFEHRFAHIGNLLEQAQLPFTQVVRSQKIWFVEQLAPIFTSCIDAGYEGVMLRPPGDYEPGKRSKSLWKYKDWDTDDFLCVGITQGEGKASIGIGALVLLCNEVASTPAKTFEVGTGFSDDLRRELWLDRPIGKKIRIRYAPCLTNDGKPTHASFLAIL